MSARDRILSLCPRQSEMMRDNYLFLSSLDYPLCVRNSEGNFLYSNAKFSEDVKGHDYDEATWFSNLPAHIQLELLKCELEVLSSSNCVVLSKVFQDHSFECMVVFQKILHANVFCASWLFIKNVIYSDEINPSDSKNTFKGKPVRNPKLAFEPNVYHTFCLFFTCFSHEFIANILSVSVNATKKRISKCYQTLGIENKDEMILYLKAGGYLLGIHDTAFRIIRERFRADAEFSRNK